MRNANDTIDAHEAHDCEHCLFGTFAPDRYTQKKYNGTKDVVRVCHCTINPPIYPSGHPIVECNAVCALFTERGGGYNQPLRSLIFPNGTTGFTLTMKG